MGAKWVVDAQRGNDRNTGRSKATALQTLEGLSRVLRAGDTAILRGTFRELHRITVGDFGSRSTLYMPDDEMPVLLGSTPVSGSWSLVSGSEYQIATALVWAGHHIWWYPDSPLFAQPLALGTAGSLAVGEYAIAGGLLHVNIGSAPLTTDTFEVPLTASVNLIEIDAARNITLEGLGIRFSGADGVLLMNAPDCITLQGLDVANCIGNLLHCTLGSGTTNIDFDANYLHDQYGQQNAMGLHNGTTGRVRNNTIARISKWGIASADTAIIDCLDNKLDGAKIYVVSNGAGGGRHRYIGNQQVNEPPEAGLADPMFYVDPSVTPATPILIENHSQARGAGSNILRGIRCDSGAVKARNVGIWGAFQYALMDGSGLGTIDSDYVAVGGATVADRYNWPTGAHDVALSADPFANVSANDLAPAVASPLIAAGTARDIGYTG